MRGRILIGSVLRFALHTLRPVGCCLPLHEEVLPLQRDAVVSPVEVSFFNGVREVCSQI